MTTMRPTNRRPSPRGSWAPRPSTASPSQLSPKPAIPSFWISFFTTRETEGKGMKIPNAIRALILGLLFLHTLPARGAEERSELYQHQERAELLVARITAE